MSGWVGEEPAHSADDQVHSHAVLSRFIEKGDHLHVNERVDLRGDVRAATSLRLLGCRQNPLSKGAPQLRWRYEEALVFGVLREAGQVVEQSTQVVAKILLSRKEGDIGVEACGLWVVVSC